MLEPRPVLPGYVRRWTRQAAHQVWRHAQTYVLLLALPVLPALFASHDPWRTLTGALLGPFALRLSLEIAAATSRAEVPTAAYPALLRQAIGGSADDLRRHARRLLLLLAGFGLAIAVFAAWPPTAEIGTATPPDGGAARTLALFLPVAAQLFVGLTLMHGVSPAGSLMVSLVASTHRVDPVVARRAVAQAWRQNPRAFFFLDQALHAATFIVVVAATPLAPIALAVLPALVAAAMREIFGPRDREPAREASKDKVPDARRQPGWRPAGDAGST